MQIGYRCPSKRLSLIFRRAAILVVGVAALPLMTQVERVAQANPTPAKQAIAAVPDPRTVRLVRFFSKLHCPVVNLAEDFIHAADNNHLDWRLLPSIAVIESGGGKAFKNNNIFGWNQGEELFPTIRAGIEMVAFKLGTSPLYRNRDVPGKLRIYNPYGGYAESVLTVMNRISPVVELKPLKPVRRTNEFTYSSD